MDQELSLYANPSIFCLFSMAGRATPDKLMTYKLALQLYKTYNNAIPSIDCMNINFNGINTSRQTKFAIKKTNNLKVGMNVLSHRLWCLNGQLI